MKNPFKRAKVYDSYNDLVWAVAQSLPDQYPEAMATLFADDMLADGSALIKNDSGDRTTFLGDRAAHAKGWTAPTTANK